MKSEERNGNCFHQTGLVVRLVWQRSREQLRGQDRRLPVYSPFQSKPLKYYVFRGTMHQCFVLQLCCDNSFLEGGCFVVFVSVAQCGHLFLAFPNKETLSIWGFARKIDGSRLLSLFFPEAAMTASPVQMCNTSSRL